VVAEPDARLVRPDRADEPARFGDLGGVRQWIEAIFDTLKDQLGLERHGAHTIQGVWIRVAQRLLAWPPGSGSSGSSAPRSSARWSPTTISPSTNRHRSSSCNRRPPGGPAVRDRRYWSMTTLRGLLISNRAVIAIQDAKLPGGLVGRVGMTRLSQPDGQKTVIGGSAMPGRWRIARHTRP
jgi:hypothetical protein